MPVKTIAVGGDGKAPTRLILGTVNNLTTLTRPADTAAYTAGDEVSNATAQGSALPWVFAGAGSGAGGSGYVVRAALSCSDKLNVSAIYRLFLYSSAPTMVGDNAAYNLLKAEFPGRIGYVDIGPMVTAVGASSDSAFTDVDLRKSYQCAADANLYGVLVVQGAYTPLSAETFQLSLTVERN